MEKDLKKIFADNEIEIKGIGSYCCIDASGLNLLKIRDLILGKYDIVIENKEEQYYICSVKIGMTNTACVVKLNGNMIEMYCFAKEGLIKRNLAQRVISDIRRVLENGK